MTVATERLTEKQAAILKQLKRKPHTTSETVDLLNKAAQRRYRRTYGRTTPYGIFHTYSEVHSSLRRMEDRELVRRTVTHGTPFVIAWQLTDKGRDLL